MAIGGAAVGFWVAAGVLLIPADAHAYLDASTGSLILQAAIATIAGTAVTVRVYWGRIKAWARPAPAEPEQNEPGGFDDETP